MKRTWPRRRFLEGFGGALVALPLLEAARAAPAAPDKRAKRFVAIAHWDGVIPAMWFPTGSETNFTLPAMSAPLAKHQANLIVPKGINNQVAIEASERNGHIEGCLSFLTGWTGTESPRGTNNWKIAPGATSVDQVIAQDLEKQGVVTRLPYMAMNDGGGYGGLAYSAGKPAGGNGASGYFSSLFKNPAQSAQALMRAQARRKSILDGSLADFQRLAMRVSGEDRRRIDAHLEALRQTEKRLAANAGACDATGVVVTDLKGRDQEYRAALDVVILALSCDVTRVATINWEHAGGGGPSMPWIGVNEDMHELSHQVVGDKAGSASHQAFTKVQAWLTGQLAYFVDRLKATPTADGGTLLDETVILRGSEISFDHNQPDMPYLIVAGDKTPFKTGRFVSFTPRVTHNNMLVSILHAFGIPATTFGNPAYSTGNLDAALLRA